MPIYAFECTNCGHTFDRLQKISDADPTTCPNCGQDTVKRQVTAPSFRLSGSGWYETDFKNGGDKKKNLTEGTSKPAESKPAETKPAAKPSSSD